jgi:hypothetical protein
MAEHADGERIGVKPYRKGSRRPQRALCDASTNVEMLLLLMSVVIGVNEVKRSLKPVLGHCS